MEFSTRRAALTALAPVVLVGAVALERVSRASLERVPSAVTEEFPGIDRDLLEKFSSFDAELGWVPQPNTKKQKDTDKHVPGEEVKNVVEYSTDEYGSRVCPGQEREAGEEGTVATYGDSYCFCREVDDGETFQAFLGERRDSYVRNYGAGNYGFDQALLRLKRQYDEDPTDHVCIVVTAASIARILSVWKHYQEFGNILATKPRYDFSGDSPELIETPIEEKEDLLSLRSFAGFLRTNDYHYEHWFRPHHATFPYTPDFLKNPDHVRYALASGLEDAESEYGVSVPGVDAVSWRRAVENRLEEPRVRYHADLWEEKAAEFVDLVGEFVDFAEEKEFTPTFVMLQQLRYVRYEDENGRVYGDLMERLDERYDDLVIVDMADHLGVEDAESLYVERGEGGHHSPAANRRIAEVLEAELFGDGGAEPEAAAVEADDGAPDA